MDIFRGTSYSREITISEHQSLQETRTLRRVKKKKISLWLGLLERTDLPLPAGRVSVFPCYWITRIIRSHICMNKAVFFRNVKGALSAESTKPECELKCLMVSNSDESHRMRMY